MSELGDELQRVSDEAAREARPLSPAEVIRRGDRRRRRRMARNAVAALAVAATITAGVLSSASGGQHTIPQRPATRPSTPMP